MLNTWVCALSFSEWLDLLERLIRDKRSRVVHGHHNLHSMYLCSRDPKMQAFFEAADLVYIDGTPVRWLLNSVGASLSAEYRFTLMDLFEKFLEHAEIKGWRVFYVGGSSATLQRAASRIQEEFPALQFGCHQGYFASTGVENDKVLQAISDFSPDVLLVGMGMPRQEYWIADNRPRLEAANIVSTGATIDYYAGEQHRPPPWLGPLGLSGLYRMTRDPKRLWRRYLIEPLIVAPDVVRWVLGRRIGSGRE
ncbi:MAG: WecB/TagA/CpsF family glycosyltransferase [Pseudomonadota bacterium]